jgi:hypothetical protein
VVWPGPPVSAVCLGRWLATGWATSPRVGGGEIAWLTPGPFERKINGSRNAEEKDSERVTSAKVRGS